MDEFVSLNFADFRELRGTRGPSKGLHMCTFFLLLLKSSGNRPW